MFLQLFLTVLSTELYTQRAVYSHNQTQNTLRGTMVQKPLQAELKSSFTKWQLSSFQLQVQHLCLLPNTTHFPSSFKCSDNTFPESLDAIFF